MKDIVILKNNKPVTNTFIISESLELDHSSVKRLVKVHSNTEILNGFEIEKVTTKGRPQEIFILDELQATFLVTLMKNNKKVVKFKSEMTIQFFKQRQYIQSLVQQHGSLEWLNVRKNGKIIVRQKTDVIKNFIEYAIEQGSKSANRYYTNFAKMENQAMFIFEQKYPNMREVLTIKQLMQVATADDIIEKAIKEGMDQGLFYKDIYKLAKERIIKYVEIIGKSPILSLGQK